MDENVAIRSEESTEKVYVRFVNLTDRTAEIVWVNFAGLFERYVLLRRKQYFEVNTFKTHPWVAMDVHTKDRLYLNNKYVFNPLPWRDQMIQRANQKYPALPIEKRTIVRITTPLYSLRYRCLLKIRNLLKSPEDIYKLELPNLLVDDLKTVVTLKEKHSVVEPHRTRRT